MPNCMYRNYLVEQWSSYAFFFSVFQNVTNTIVKTMLRNDDSAQGVIHHLKVASPIHCVFQNNLLTSSGYTAEG